MSASWLIITFQSAVKIFHEGLEDHLNSNFLIFTEIILIFPAVNLKL